MVKFSFAQVVKPKLARPSRIPVTACAWDFEGKRIVGGIGDGSIQVPIFFPFLMMLLPMLIVLDQLLVFVNFSNVLRVGCFEVLSHRNVKLFYYLLQLWTIKTGWGSRPDIYVEKAHSDDITGLKFSADGQILLSRSMDATLKASITVLWFQ